MNVEGSHEEFVKLPFATYNISHNLVSGFSYVAQLQSRVLVSIFTMQKGCQKISSN
jgi:hypothetical protein